MRTPSHKFGDLQKIPNEDSPQRTVASVYIDAHYATLGLIDRWTWDKYTRFCEILRWTPYEVASLVGMPHTAVDRFQHNDMLTGPGALAWAIHLTNLEWTLMKDYVAGAVNPFPKLPEIPKA
jgi:hypothetical protein